MLVMPQVLAWVDQYVAPHTKCLVMLLLISVLYCVGLVRCSRGKEYCYYRLSLSFLFFYKKRDSV